jgi:N-acetylglucosamine kinase-like BadF-type ATPase
MAENQTPEKQRQERERVQNRSMGHNLKSTVEQALDETPNMLGQYLPQLQQAYESGDSMAIQAVLSELERDHNFRINVLPQLQASTNQTGDY